MQKKNISGRQDNTTTRQHKTSLLRRNEEDMNNNLLLAKLAEKTRHTTKPHLQRFLRICD